LRHELRGSSQQWRAGTAACARISARRVAERRAEPGLLVSGFRATSAVGEGIVELVPTLADRGAQQRVLVGRILLRPPQRERLPSPEPRVPFCACELEVAPATMSRRRDRADAQRGRRACQRLRTRRAAGSVRAPPVARRHERLRAREREGASDREPGAIAGAAAQPPSFAGSMPGDPGRRRDREGTEAAVTPSLMPTPSPKPAMKFGPPAARLRRQ
jgi:hypothetical protein